MFVSGNEILELLLVRQSSGIVRLTDGGKATSISIYVVILE